MLRKWLVVMQVGSGGAEMRVQAAWLQSPGQNLMLCCSRTGTLLSVQLSSENLLVSEPW